MSSTSVGYFFHSQMALPLRLLHKHAPVGSPDRGWQRQTLGIVWFPRKYHDMEIYVNIK